MELLSSSALARLHPTELLEDSGRPHPERRERIDALAALGPVDVARHATREQLLRVHQERYLTLLEGLDRQVFLDPHTPAGPTSWEAARLCAGLALEAVDRGGFALGRPPGHHAFPGEQKGFCLLNNVAVAARYAQAELGAARVAIVDFDVHHGNGTEAIFRDDASVLTISLHRWPNVWSGSGGVECNDGANLNVPLPAGSGDADYARAFDEIVEPAVRTFAPDVVLVAAGFDGHVEDPVSDVCVTEVGFRELGARCAAMAPRTAAVLEGGYNLATLPALVAAAHEGLRGG